MVRFRLTRFPRCFLIVGQLTKDSHMPRHHKKRLPEGPFYRDLGRTIRFTRTAAGKSQIETAGHLDVTFQQVQKYEAGTNRIPLDRLVSLSDFLDVPLSHFVAAGGASDGESALLSLIEQFEGKEFKTLLESWTAIKDRHARAALLNLMKCMAARNR
jgi:transcriptional regulator with XRE-family HTH domain